MSTKHKDAGSTRSVTQTRTQTRVRQLSDSEEKVLRMSKGMGVDEDTPLEAKTNNPELLAKLRDIEAELFIRAGKIEPLSKKQQIIDKLRRR